MSNRKDDKDKADKANRDNHLNPNNDAYWQSRGYDARPENWKELLAET